MNQDMNMSVSFPTTKKIVSKFGLLDNTEIPEMIESDGGIGKKSQNFF